MSFIPTLSYSVPVAGWSNLEDNPGNFLLVPPGQLLAGVNAGTSDFIGVYTSVVAAQFTDGGTCDDLEAVPGVAATPDAIAEWMAEQPALTVSDSVATAIGGLSGQFVDVRIVDGATIPSCTDPQSGEQVPVFLLFIGVAPSSLAHGVIPDMTFRIYLLDYDDGTLAIEVDDIDAAPATLDQLTAVVDDFAFSL